MTRPGRRPAAPDFVRRDFTTEEPDLVWVGDMTEMDTGEGTLYLATVIDLLSRRLLGYAMGTRHDAELVVASLNMTAATRGGDVRGVIMYTDRGGEYTSARFRDRIGELGLRQSCGRAGSCFDNAAAESFWALLKEEIGTRVWHDRATARADVLDFIETFYNRRRLRRHKVFGYLTPAETRKRHRHALAAQPSSVQDHGQKRSGDSSPTG
ncbi:IS3 family transposase [Streptomyces sp. HNM0645]|uniref:IS3 family transposase n=1 Tax=Streptomyces sp. HNM0645 TaxID=2782343 RepID=UPI0024B7B9DD|nr:IS3 family transposase [Streptomyces sp. HNM0645]MDI9883727.1 IS3 family transposase [Streptomyces sp. HNM0645]